MKSEMDAISVDKIASIGSVDALIEQDVDKVAAVTAQYTASDVPTVQDVAKYLIQSGGKRIRPKLVLLAARACGAAVLPEACEAAVVIEFIHSATLLHDDVVDEADTRRHRAAARMVWGNQASVLVGDFLYARAFELLATRDNIPLMRLLAQTTAALSEGEVDQLTQLHNHSTSHESYTRVIAAKTGALFAASAQAGAMIACPDATSLQQQFYQYGMNLGLAFQVVDDMLDYDSDEATLGKTIAKDLLEGKITLPLIYLLQRCDASEYDFLTSVIAAPETQHVAQVMTLMAHYQVGPVVYQVACDYAVAAKSSLSQLANSSAKDALLFLADYAVQRCF